MTTDATITATADMFAGGYIITTDDTGEGKTYRIRGNTASGTPAATYTRLELYDKLQSALDATTDASIFGSGVAGREGFDVYTLFNNLMKSRENVGPGVFNAWTPTNTDTNVPALTLKDNNGEGRTSDYFIVNTSYFKISNLQLGYSITPKSVFTRVRVYTMAENLFWFKSKSYLSPDPESIDLDPVPIPKTFTFGINASF
jgi:hypothetical protein